MKTKRSIVSAGCSLFSFQEDVFLFPGFNKGREEVRLVGLLLPWLLLKEAAHDDGGGHDANQHRLRKDDPCCVLHSISGNRWHAHCQVPYTEKEHFTADRLGMLAGRCNFRKKVHYREPVFPRQRKL